VPVRPNAKPLGGASTVSVSKWKEREEVEVAVAVAVEVAVEVAVAVGVASCRRHEAATSTMTHARFIRALRSSSGARRTESPPS